MRSDNDREPTVTADRHIADFPQIVDCRVVFDPGCHCAFTDLTVWGGRVWLAFREAVNHSIHPSSRIVVAASADWGRSFDVFARVAAPGYDIRDPHFFVCGDRLHLVCPSWRLPQRTRHTILARSDDGVHWEQFAGVAAFAGRGVWRPRRSSMRHDAAVYAAAYSSDPTQPRSPRQVHLLRSEDGLDWQEASLIAEQGRPNETELCFLPDGELLALVRREDPPNQPLLARATPPYARWQTLDCDRFLQGPLLERLPDGRLLVAGRSKRDLAQPQGAPSVTRLFLLDDRSGRLAPGPTLESGGDTSYCGFCLLPEDAAADDPAGANALLSYYSGHRHPNGSYRGGNLSQRCSIHVVRLRV
jgi:hypothetical protein